MNAIVTLKNGSRLEFPYYQLETVCKMLIREYLYEKGLTLKEYFVRKKVYYEFQKNYKTFSPYFDFVFQKLGVQLENPFFLVNTSLFWERKAGIIYYFAKSNQKFVGDSKEFELPIFLDGREENILREKIHSNCDNLIESFVNPSLEMLSFKGECAYHNFWAQKWNHDLLQKNSFQCSRYLEELERTKEQFLFDQSGFLLSSVPFLQLSYTNFSSVSTFLVRYDREKLKESQFQLIEEMKKRSHLFDIHCLEISRKKGQNEL